MGRYPVRVTVSPLPEIRERMPDPGRQPVRFEIDPGEGEWTLDDSGV
jgi:hypothetical protein